MSDALITKFVFNSPTRGLFATTPPCFLLVLCCAFAAAGQRRASAPVHADAVKTENQFNWLAAQAADARESNRLDEAIALYRKALAVRPKWTEGWWYLATILYDRDAYEEAARSFEEASILQPKAGAVWAMLGLCEYDLGRYDDALVHIQQAHQLGLAKNPELTRAVRYHEGVLLNIKGRFEAAQQTLSTLSSEGMESESVIIALGLAVLRLPILPKDIASNQGGRELIRRAGWAENLHAQKNIGDAQQEYERLVADFPKTTNVQYAFGRFLLAQRDDEKALTAFEREIQNSPNHAMARFQIAYIKMNNKDAAGGLEFASQGVKLNPRLPLGHYILGRLLFDAGQNDRAIEELETAQHLDPDEAKIYFALWRVYARVKRETDAERARATFIRLNQLNEEATQQGIGSGESSLGKSPVTTKPTPP